MSGATATKYPESKFPSIKVGREFGMKAFHLEMQALRQKGADVTLKQYLEGVYGAETTPEVFYQNIGVDLKSDETIDFA